jgi:type III secretion protein U
VTRKRHPPSARRLAEVRAQGQLARSRLLTAAAPTLGGLLGLVASAPASGTSLARYAERLLGGTPPSPAAALAEALQVLTRAAAPTLLGATAGALAAGVAAAGLQLQPAALAPRLERLDPVAGLSRLLRLDRMAELGVGLLAAGVVGAWLVRRAMDLAPEALRLVWRDGASAPLAVHAAWASAALGPAVLLGLLGAADLARARHAHRARLRMTDEELRREQQRTEGDPRLKGQRQAVHRRLASGGPARGVERATALVVNPTHLAVALRYAEGECDAPYLVASGRGEDARALRWRARALGIPVVKDVPLARLLVLLEVGEAVPEELYRAAAAVLTVALEAPARGGRDAP